ncbi:hypothetical protein JH06_1905 [Blastocystis sp. subtype 4]|uniref:hypothetical protein n=1 Tax=Blastocystis sp. subtype 4 TaxID=944170 RepID=UPI000711A364|nr:hypothetical protein JH06_1905 [Blastocystis sp. subtype 4]KNB44176.1 hypothetical protein JH06_1905 [Blastocystis sp. subtype 4]|eukprot:XP_014527619.1 hypothetical protein JH06_1905 [Blastocystis sp. subtype 4]
MSLVPDNRLCTVKCCLCGVDIPGSGASMCNNCIINNTNIAEGIEPEISITYCKQCNSGKGICRRAGDHVEDDQGNELVDAHFIWTEPHSHRIIIELELKKEIRNGFSIIGKTRVTFIQVMHLCDECYKLETENTWEAIVKIRQKVDHKRTLLWLEQNLVNTGRHSDSIGVQIVNGGLDFYFAKRIEAQQFVEYIKTQVIVKGSMKLKYQDLKSNIGYFEHQFYIELSPVCKDDLVLLPKGCANQLSLPLVVCNKISTSLSFIHPSTAKVISVSSLMYSKYPFTTLLVASGLKEFTVLDVVPVNEQYGKNKDDSQKYLLADIEVIRSDDFGVSDSSCIVRSHLGNILQAGDLVLGYDMRSTVWNCDELDKYDPDSIPDVILVKKQRDPDQKKSRKHRNRVKRFKEVNETEVEDIREVEKYEEDREEFSDSEEQ